MRAGVGAGSERNIFGSTTLNSIIARLDQGHRYTLLEVPGLTCPGRGSVGSEHSRKEPSRQLIRWLFGTPTHDEADVTPDLYMAPPVQVHSTWTTECRRYA